MTEHGLPSTSPGHGEGAPEPAGARHAEGSEAPGASGDPGSRGGSGLGRWLWDWSRSVLIALLLFLVVRTFFVEAFQIPTSSMENTLLVGDFLLVNKVAYGAEIPGTPLQLPGYDRPERGDVVVFEPPPEAGQPPHTNYVKRIVGVPGDTLSMREGVLVRNGTAVPEPYAKRNGAADVRNPRFRWQRSHIPNVHARPRYRPSRDNWGPLVVPPEHYFVMGDNRENSEDSRYWGFVPANAIKGRPLIIYYSYDRRKPAALRWLTEIRWDRLLHTID